MNNHSSSLSQPVKMNRHLHQDLQSNNQYSQMAQPRNKFHGQPLLFHRNPQTKEPQCAHAIQESKLANIAQQQPQQFFAAAYQAHRISHEEPQILLKQPRLSPSIVEKAESCYILPDNTSTNSLPPNTSDFCSASEQSPLPRNIGLIVSANSNQPRSIHGYEDNSTGQHQYEQNTQQQYYNIHCESQQHRPTTTGKEQNDRFTKPFHTPDGTTSRSTSKHNGSDKEQIYDKTNNEVPHLYATSSNQLPENQTRRNSSYFYQYQNSPLNTFQTFGEILATNQDKWNGSTALHEPSAIQNQSQSKKNVMVTFESTCFEDQCLSKSQQELIPQQILNAQYIRNDENSSINMKMVSNSQAAVDSYSLEAQETIPQIVMAVQSMAHKSNDIERFLDSQERHIEGAFAQLASCLKLTKETLLNTISACRKDVRRRYNEIHNLFQKNLKDLVNSQEDIQLNYTKIISEFEEQQVNLVIQAYNDQLYEAQSLVFRSRGSELLDVLKFDISTLSSLQDSIDLTALTSLKKIRTTFVKSNSSSSACSSPYGSPIIGSRSSLKNGQKVTQMPGLQFDSRKSQFEGSKRSPRSKQFSLNKVLSDSTKNNNNLSYCSYGNSMSNNSSYHNNSFMSCLESPLHQSQFGSRQQQKEQNLPNASEPEQRQAKQAASQIGEKQGKSVFVSFDNKEAFKITGNQENKENTFRVANTNNKVALRNKSNERSKQSYSKNSQSCIPTVKANFSIPLRQERNSGQSNRVERKDKSSSSSSSYHTTNDILSKQQTGYLSQWNIIATENNSQRQSSRSGINNTSNNCQEQTFLNDVRNEQQIDQGNTLYPTGLTETDRLQAKEHRQEYIALASNCDQTMPSTGSCQQQQIANSGSFPTSLEISKEVLQLTSSIPSLSEQSILQHNKFNDILKVVQANQMQRNQNCQAILQQVSDSIRGGSSRSSSASSSIQGRQSHNRSGSTQTSSIAASTRFERVSLSQHVKQVSEVSQNVFSSEEQLHNPYADTLYPVVPEEQQQYQQQQRRQYQNSIEEVEVESDKGLNLVAGTESSECKSISDQDNHSLRKGSQQYIPFMSPIGY